MTISGSNKNAINMAYITKVTLLPISVVVINQEGFFKNLDKILSDVWPCLLLSSICSLSAEIKAISTPEKKAESTNETMTIIK